jgi:hypothetical protein
MSQPSSQLPCWSPTTIAKSYSSTVAPDHPDHIKPPEFGNCLSLWDGKDVYCMSIKPGGSRHQLIGDKELAAAWLRFTRPGQGSRWWYTPSLPISGTGHITVYLQTEEGCQTKEWCLPSGETTEAPYTRAENGKDSASLSVGKPASCLAGIRKCRKGWESWDGPEGFEA